MIKLTEKQCLYSLDKDNLKGTIKIKIAIDGTKVLDLKSNANIEFDYVALDTLNNDINSSINPHRIITIDYKKLMYEYEGEYYTEAYLHSNLNEEEFKACEFSIKRFYIASLKNSSTSK